MKILLMNYMQDLYDVVDLLNKIYHATHLIFKNQENIDGSYIPNFSNSHIFDVL